MTVLGALYYICPITHSTDKPLRLLLHDVYKRNGIGTVSVCRVETDVLKPVMVVPFVPISVTAEANSA